MTSIAENYLHRHSISESTILVALSGGPDSVCLLYVLSELKTKFNLNIKAAYVDHGIRSISDNKKDEDLVKAHCNLLNIRLHIKNIPNGYIENLTKVKKSSTEAIAREVRYEFFRSIKNIDYIALGHNKNDQLETMIMRYFQGSTLEGLVGIPEINGKLIRPLIDIEKKDILDYLDINNLSYNIDKTNLENDYLRNKVRNSLIPIVKDIFPGYTQTLPRVKSEFNSYLDFYNDKRIKPVWQKCKGGYSIKYTDFLSLNFLERTSEIYYLYNRLYKNVKSNYRLPSRFLKPLIKSSFKNREIILDGHNIRFYCKKPFLYFIEYK